MPYGGEGGITSASCRPTTVIPKGEDQMNYLPRVCGASNSSADGTTFELSSTRFGTGMSILGRIFQMILRSMEMQCLLLLLQSADRHEIKMPYSHGFKFILHNASNSTARSHTRCNVSVTISVGLCL